MLLSFLTTGRWCCGLWFWGLACQRLKLLRGWGLQIRGASFHHVDVGLHNRLTCRCWHSINLTLRALKGLRRAQWANMPEPRHGRQTRERSYFEQPRFSVLYSVPVEAFPVVWERPQESLIEDFDTEEVRYPHQQTATYMYVHRSAYIYIHACIYTHPKSPKWAGTAVHPNCRIFLPGGWRRPCQVANRGRGSI